ncbi:MAG TPA: DUF255 domain-containing protein [Planctomycetota bacterium]|nr:DUF255 domain-containing protein [Planctomycetota bacterium]
MPVDWSDWSVESFRRARETKRPILLALVASWSPWSRMMDREAYSDPEIARLAAADFVAIRADVDRRPDVNDRYNPGAIPAVALLDSEGTLLYATAYMDADELRMILGQLVESYKAGPAKLGEAARERDEKVRAILRGRHPVPGVLGPEIVTRTLEGILADLDPIHGGFGRGAKLPLPASLMLLAECVKDDPRVRPALAGVLESLMTRGLADRVEEGFFAGCAGEGWTRPSTEKLLDVNARLARAFFAGGRALGDERFILKSGETVDWIRSTLLDPDRGEFFGSQSADEEYYSRDAKGRSEMARPPVDRTVYVDRSALAASAFLALGVPASAAIAKRALDGLLESGGEKHCEGGSTGLLRDRVALGHALLDDGRTVEAERIGSRLVADFWSAEEQGLLDRRPGVEELGELSRPRSDPAETGEGARFLLRLATAANEPRYRADAERILRGFPDFAPDWGHSTAEIASAVLLWLKP